MKRGLLIFFLVLAGMLAAALQGCKGGGKIEPEEPVEEPLLIDTTIVVPATGGKNRFSIISHSRWKTSVVSGAAWCHVTPADGGSGGSTIAVTCDPNDEFAVRQALVRIDNATTHGTIAVIQQQIDVLDLTVDDECEFGPQGGNFAAKLDYNIDYTVTFSADWVRQVQTKAPLHADLMFEVDKNNSGADRQCEVTVAGGDFSHTVTVSQIAAYITLSIDDVALEASVTRLPVMVESNVSYVSYLPEDAPWLSITGDTSGGTDGQKSSMIFDVAIEENEGWFLREGIVSFGNPDYNLTGSLHILHKAVDIMYASLPLFEFGPEGGSFEFDTDPTKEYKFTVDGADWVKVSTLDGNPARRIITVDKSLSGEGRTASLTISRGNAKKTLDFSQAGVAPEFSAQELRFASAGGSQTLSVTGSVEYTLVPPEDAPWCTVAAAEDGGYTVTVAANDTEQSRTCRIGFVNKEYEVSETVTVLQAQKDAFEVNPQSFSFGPEGGKAEVDIHTNIGYTCESDAPEWISGDAGTTGGKREFTVALNDSGKARQGRLTFTAEGFEKIVSIDQEAAFITASQHDIEYNDQPFEGSFEVSANVPFRAKAQGDEWFSMEVSGTNVTFSATENNEWGSRLAEIVLYNSTYKASDTVYVRQGAKYYLDIKQMEFDLTPAGGTVALEVSSNKEYTYYIEGSPDWISEVSPLVFEVVPNLDSQARDVRIVFEQNGKSKSVSIWQDAPALVVSPARLEFAAAGGEGAISITGNVGFTVSQPSEDWAQCTGTASSCTISVAPNPEPEMRSCTIEISSAEFGRTVTVEVVQAAKGIFELLTDAFSLGPEGGEITIEVNTNVEFTSSPKVDWIIGEGLSFSVALNASGEEREGIIEFVADGYNHIVSVTQSAAFVNVDKDQLDLPVDGGRRSFSITANVGFEVSAPDEDWVLLTTVSDNTYEVEVPQNDGEQVRECVIDIISADYGIARKVTVVQDCSDFFELTTTELEFGPEGGEAEVQLRTNTDYTVSVSADWITYEGDCKLTVGKNATGQERDGTIDYEVAGEVYTVAVHQGSAWLNIDKEVVQIEQEGGSFVVSAESNVPFAVVMPQEDWISAAEPTEDSGFAFDVAQFADYGTRSCTVLFKADDYNLSRAVKVTQSGLPDPFSVKQKEYFVGPCGGELEVLHTECRDVDVSVSGAAWIRELPARREDTLLVFQLDSMFTKSTREAVVTIVGDGRPQTVYIFQNPPMMVLTYNEKSFPDTGGTLSINMISNFAPNFYTDQEWVSGSVADDFSSISFTVAPNDTGVERTAVVEVGLKQMDYVQEVTITQAANDQINLDPAQIDVPSDGGEYYVTVDANVSYTTMAVTSWISFSSTETPNLYKVKVAANTSAKSRASSVMFSGGKATSYLRVNQAGYRNPDYYYSEDFSKNHTSVKIQSATEGDGIPLVLMGDAFSDRLIDDGTYERQMRRAVEAIFEIEPYKSHRNLFNIWYINIVSLNEIYADDAITELSTHFEQGSVVTGDHSAVRSLVMNLLNPLLIKNAAIVVLMNTETYGGSTYMFDYLSQDSSDWGVGEAIAYIPLCTSDEQFTGVVQHEVGGHCIGKLEDEYYYSSSGAIPASKVDYYKKYQAAGFYRNVDFTSNPSEVLWAKFLTDEDYQYDGLGVFEGACIYSTGAYRATQESMMYHNEGGFNAPSREAIYYRLHKIAYGSSWQYNFEEFKQYDAINRRSSPSSSQTGRKKSSSAAGAMPHLPPPVMLKR